MNRIRTYLDANILIHLARGKDGIHWKKCWDIINDSHRDFVSSMFLKLEVLPKAIFHRNEAEAQMYHDFFWFCN